MCDNCKEPKEKKEGKHYVQLLLKGVYACRERFKPKEMASIMIGDSNSLIKQHMSQIEHVFGSGKNKSIGFWHSIIRQVYVKQLLTKEIESYGTLKITDLGKEYIKNPYSFEITEDHDYDNMTVTVVSKKELQ
jgi:ATP-dependent DNA helicase RecQ